jgi:phage portal protein BeeE/phage head maturation protease
VTVPPEISGLWLSNSAVLRVSRTDALSVPAVLRCRNLIAGGLGVLPLHLVDPDRKVVPSNLLDQPEQGVARSVSMTMVFEDLLLEGIAWWRVRKFAWTGYPETVERVEPGRATVQQNGQVLIDGRPVPDSELIRFDSPNPGLLTVAARAIRSALLLDQAAARYSAEPLPSGYFEPREGADPADDDTVQELLDSWATARQSRATAYIPAALKYSPLQWSPEQLQLADARQHAVLEIARAAGVSPEDLGVSTTSRSYSNLEMDEQKFVTETLSLYGQAVAERLSMGDVTPRGYRVRVEYAGRLRTDTKGRYEAYQLGLDVGALGEDEIRELEDKPRLPASQKPEPAPVPVQPQEAPVQQSASRADVEAFTAQGETLTLTFAPSDVDEFRADPVARTVSGMLLPYNVQTVDGRRIRFAPGSVEWQKAAVSRVKLDREHDLGKLLGSATKVASSDKGVSAAFKVAKTPAGDEALALAADGALDGLSAVVSITDAIPDPVNEGGTLVTSARLVRATLTAEPAFDDARLTDVALTSRTVEQENTVPDNDQGGTATVTAPDQTAAFTAAVEAFTAAVAQLAAPQGREVVPAGRALGFAVTEAPVYSFSGHGDSLVRDAWNARQNGDPDAGARLRKFTAQMAEFATVNRTVGANVIPPGYRPDLFVPQLLQGRPLMDMLSRGTLTDATPFTIPRFGSATGATADHVEGTNPADGTLAMATSVTVTPVAVSGRFRITREIIDAANPAIDAIAATALRESYSQQVEGKAYTLLNGANGVGGTITAGFVPSGAAVVTATGVGSTGAAGVALINAVRQQMVEYPFRRFARPDRLAASSEGAVSFAKAVDSTGRPILPRLGAMNASGEGNALAGVFDMDGLAVTPAWSMTGNAAGDADTILFNSSDVWAWESNLLSFRYEEVAGPANIDLAVFGYFAAAIIRAAGFSAVRLTVT